MTAGEAGTHRDAERLPAAYAAWRHSVLGRVTDALEQDLILELVRPSAGLRILDVGCGDGVLAEELARYGAQVTGVDASEAMVAAARKRAERHGDRISFEVARAEALPFETGRFDVVVAITVLCFVENAGGALREMSRVLKPDGHLIIGELGRYSSWAAVRRIKGWLGSPVWRHARFRTPSQFERLAAEAGLVAISVKGAIFYPPLGIAARLLAPLDRKMGAWTTTGAAFLVLTASRPRAAEANDGVELARS